MFRNLFKDNINIFIRTLVVSDFFLFFSLGLLTPIFAIFILDRVAGSDLRVIGFSAMFYWLARVLSVIPISKLMDKIKGEKDEYYIMLAGSLIIGITPLFFILVSEAWHIYLIQVISGLSFSMVIPGWRIIFVNHLDKDKVGFEWSLEDVGVGVSTAISAAIGAIIAETYGFNALFILVSCVSLTSTIILFSLCFQEESRTNLNFPSWIWPFGDKKKRLGTKKEF